MMIINSLFFILSGPSFLGCVYWHTYTTGISAPPDRSRTGVLFRFSVSDGFLLAVRYTDSILF